MSVKYHADLIQGSDEWLAARCGLLTASEMKLIVTPGTIKPANNDKVRAHMFELMAQRITRYVEPRYIGDDMLRGQEDEIEARILYAERYAPVHDMGFITNSEWGFTLGFSPDGLVGDDGFIECKSRRQRFQVETIARGVMPDDFMVQVQTGFLVSGRKWADFVSYSGGLPMVTIRVEPDPKIMDAIVEAATGFEAKMTEWLDQYGARLSSGARLIPTERRIELEMFA
ncbi:MAG: YqaJ-like viral recombinase [Rhodoferax sp.]|nr:YqaJ-like viral recombinase [Rhodoferax sp.]